MKFSYGQTLIKDIVVEAGVTKTGKRETRQVTIAGQPFVPTQRFWTGIQVLFGFSNNIFKYFSHKEVFDRISDVHKDAAIKYCVEHRDNTDSADRGPVNRLLAATNPKLPTVKHDDLLGLLEKHDVDISNPDYGAGFRSIQRRHRVTGASGVSPAGTPGTITVQGIDHSVTPDNPNGTVRHIPVGLPVVSYNEGVMRSIHVPRYGNTGFEICGDLFQNRFVMDTPIDGYGKPNIYLMLLRMVCTNGAIGYSPVFRSEISIGKKDDNFEVAMDRALEGFNNEEGFDCLRERFGVAAQSYASVNEVNKLYKLLCRLHGRAELRNLDKRFLTNEENLSEGGMLMEGSPLFHKFHELVGNLSDVYGLANLDSLTVKRQRTLPTQAKVYDMLNFTSEVASHYATPAGSQLCQAHLGEMLSDEFDLEGTATKFGDFKDFLISDDEASRTYSELHR